MKKNEKARYEFIGPGKHVHVDENGDVQQLEVGDVVELNGTQAQAFHDRFRPVGGEQAVGGEKVVGGDRVEADDDNKGAMHSGSDDRIEEGGETRTATDQEDSRPPRGRRYR